MLLEATELVEDLSAALELAAQVPGLLVDAGMRSHAHRGVERLGTTLNRTPGRRGEKRKDNLYAST